jgi:hypothetical protein
MDPDGRPERNEISDRIAEYGIGPALLFKGWEEAEHFSHFPLWPWPESLSL